MLVFNSFIAILTLVTSLHAAPVHPVLDASAMDTTVDPCQNFYLYSCGKWLHDFKLPEDKSSYWRQGNVLSDRVEENLNQLLSGLTEAKAKNPIEKKLGAFYRSCIEAKEGDAAGLESLQSRLNLLDSIVDKPSFARAMAELNLIGVEGLFELSDDQDPKNSSRVIAFVDRGGMNLPDPDYYLKTDAKSKETLTRYQAHIAQALQLNKVPKERALAIAEKIVQFESDLAGHALKKDDRRDMEKLFHPKSYAAFKKLVPNFDWDTYIKAMGIKPPKHMNIVEPAFLRHLNERLANLSFAELKDILHFQVIHRSAYFIPGALQNEDFNFWRGYLRGQKSLPPRWKYCTQIVSQNMGEALGQAYLASVPDAEGIRSKTELMFNNIKNAFRAELKTLAWMDSSTRAQALKKIDKMTSKIGWPKKWRDYSKLETSANQFLENEMRATVFETRRRLAKIDKPTDRSEWHMQVWEPNAYYSPADNEMVLPLGELVPPVFDPKFSDGANYASLGGSTIGHELTHGFDDSGKDMDALGNFVTWWTPKAKQQFEKLAACYIKQTEAYDIAPGTGQIIRGKATLGENLADNGGVKLGLMALAQLKRDNYQVPKFQAFNELQQYFLSYAQGWCSKMTDEQLRQSLLTNYHPPPEFRVNAVLANTPEFAEAFQCKPGAKMAPTERCTLW